MISSRNILLAVVTCAGVAAIVMACGDDGSTFKDPNATPGVFGDGGFGEASSGGPDLYKNDPLPAWCGPDSGVPQPEIGGTEECPDDKNKPGCGCNTPGETAPCWTGLRKHRNLGVCKDGVATCNVKNETLNVWSECVGQVLPVPDGKGSEACSCFSVGTWKIDNTSPCNYSPDGVNYWSYSTVPTAAEAGCTTAAPVAQGTLPNGDWSTNRLTVDCAGQYKLCFRIRAGVYENPSPTDCILGETCVDANYLEANKEQELPPLKAWFGNDSACSKKWEKDTPTNVSPGYGEMIVKGQTVRCESVDDGAGQDFVFHRVKYCPNDCRKAENANLDICKDCQLKGTGQF